VGGVPHTRPPAHGHGALTVRKCGTALVVKREGGYATGQYKSRVVALHDNAPVGGKTKSMCGGPANTTQNHPAQEVCAMEPHNKEQNLKKKSTCGGGCLSRLRKLNDKGGEEKKSRGTVPWVGDTSKRFLTKGKNRNQGQGVKGNAKKGRKAFPNFPTRGSNLRGLWVKKPERQSHKKEKGGKNHCLEGA